MSAWGVPPAPWGGFEGIPWLEGPPSPRESRLGPAADLRGVLCSGGLVWVVLAGLEGSFQSEGPVKGSFLGWGIS